MAHSHKHEHCPHVLKFCEPCRLVYCTKCPETFRTNAEWARDHRCNWSYYTPTYTYTATNGLQGVTGAAYPPQSTGNLSIVADPGTNHAEH